MKESRDVRKVTSRLEREGWQNRKGKGDHVNFFKRGNPFLITIDMGRKEVDRNIYKRIGKIAGWDCFGESSENREGEGAL